MVDATDSTMTKIARRDTSGRYAVLLAAFTINFLCDGFIFSFGVLLIALLDTFHTSRAATVLVISLMNSFNHLTGPIVGAAYDVYGGRIFVIVGTVVASIGLLTSCFAQSLIVLYVTFGVIAGSGMGFMYAPANSCLIKHFTKQRALAVGIAMSGSGLGTFVMNILVTKLIEFYGWRGAIMVISALLLNGIACGFVIREPKSIEDEQGKSDPKVKEALLVQDETNRDLKTIIKDMFDFSVLFDYRCLLFLCSTFAIQLAFTVPFSLLPDQVSGLGMSENKASWLVSSIGITNAASRIVLGWLGDRPFVNRTVMFQCVIFLAGLSVAISPLLTSFEAKLVFTCAYGICIGGYVMLLPVVLSDTFGVVIIGKSFGLTRFVVGVGGLIALPIGGWIYDTTGSYTIAFVIAGCEFIVGGLFLLIPRIINHNRSAESKSKTPMIDKPSTPLKQLDNQC